MKEIVKMTRSILPLASAERILKKCGAKRVSRGAKETLKDVLEDIAEEIAEKSIKLAIHSGRKTVKGTDVKLASRK